MKTRQRVASLILAVMMLLSVLSPAVSAGMMDPPSTGFGKVIDVRRTELAPGAAYTWYDMQTARGTQKAHFVEFDPANANLGLIAGTKSGKVRGMEGVTAMAAYADQPGNRVIAGINGDFYEISGNATGVPNGLFMGEGRILNSAVNSYAFGLKADGSSLYGTPQLTKTVTINGEASPLTHINRFRSDNQLVLYTTDYYTSTMTGNDGDEVVLEIVEGEVKHGSTLLLRVLDIRQNQGNTPLEEGQAVLSASGSARTLLAGLNAGDEISAEFALSDEWSDVQVAIGGMGPMIKDGVVQNGVGPAGVHPRTAIGTKADGSIVLFEIDGRQPGFSEGVETEELAAILADLGVVQAMNLDGGGSSTLVAKLPGESAARVMNTPSDGGERKTGNSLLLVNKAPELGSAASLAVQPSAERILAGSSFPFTAKGMDANGHPVTVDEALAWEADTALGSISAAGQFTAGKQAAEGSINVQAGGVQGSAAIEIVDKLTLLSFPDEAKTYESGAVETLKVVATRDGQVIQASNNSFEWRVEGDIGEIDADGVFTATDSNGQSGRIIASYGDLEAVMNVSVGIPPVILEDFESGLSAYIAAGAAFNTIDIAEESNPDFVRFGDTALKLSYDFTGKTGTSGAYLQAKSVDDRIQVPGYPQKIGMWVYGDGKTHWLRMQMRDGNNAAIPLDFTDQVAGVNWTGWKYVEAAVPTGKTVPFTIDMPVRYMETSNAKKDAGVIYVDQIRAIYGSTAGEDIEPPVLKDIAPASNTTVREAHPTISVIGEDVGYDPAQHPATTLIDPDKIRVYLDDQPVQHGLYPPKGLITYTPIEPLAEGRHKAKVAIRDLSGNQTIKEWYFNVNLGSPQYLYETPEEVFAGGTYDIPLTIESAAKLKSGHAELKFDPAIVQELEVVRGQRLGEAQLSSTVNAEQGTVRLDFANLPSASLKDSDVAATIRYTVKSDVIGPIGLEQAKGGEVTRQHNIQFVSGSIVMVEGDGTAKPFYGPPLETTVKNKLKLLWNHANIALGYPADFTITDGGKPVRDAVLLLDGAEVKEAVSNAEGQLVTADVALAEGTYKLQAKQGDSYSPIMTFVVAPPAHTAAPVNINVSVGENASTARHVSWQTHPNVLTSVVEWAEKEGFAGFDGDNVKQTEGASSLYNTNNDGTYRVHRAQLTGLKPDTDYVYRVGDGEGNMSAQGEFHTSPVSGDGVKFLFLGDSQASNQAGFDDWGKSLTKAVEHMPDAELLIHAGDMVDHGHEQEQWNMWFGAAQELFLKYTLQTVVGNHEVTGTNGNGDYLAHFYNPQNGSDVAKGSSYSFDMKNVHFVMLNTEMSEEAFKEQTKWLEKDLSATKKKWKVIVFHQGPYGSIYANTNVQKYWVPVFDKYEVDLVMNGHDHIYLRTFPMKGGEIVKEGEGTRYVVGGSTGPKFYALTERPWQEFVYDEDKNLYTAVEIAGDKIVITATTVDGDLVDTFEIVKKTKPTPPLTPGPEPSPEPADKPGRLEVKPGQLQGTSSGEIVIRTDAPLEELILPGHAAQLAGASDVVVEAGNIRVTLPSEWLKELAGKLPEQQLEQSKITFTIQRLDKAAAEALLNAAEARASAEIQLSGEVLALGFTVTEPDGTQTTVGQFQHAVSVSLKPGAQADERLLGMYRVSGQGELTYLGSQRSGEWLRADMSSPGQYALLEYRKAFLDVASGHWAAADIMELSAKHIIEGVSADRYAPERDVTRAEFAALLVRALGMKGESAAAFSDVTADAWYANAVNLAVQAGIVNGVGDGLFKPNASVTRQEMAAMIVRAYSFRNEEAAGDFGKAPFSDTASAPLWAQQAIAAAHGLELMQGFPSQAFKPDGFGTRAQSASLLLNLLQLLEKN
ncbi:metallophosphoesterase [Paenibacillus sp. 1011MAR3C5]|uniref:phosphodiester glycosidase family protein n=1 Tax=Paenibacillus sp. 1011MAR3C5 TaxID=1675787 RepID=UPI000E6C1435|nr:phosphodiester glycosidase family protein [Paenibacillus sp. 1011MAR3C5]RJE86116.1 metallophosphoesterase [Paenibacillus sp. 1011MAR3C5]